jgi:hypothetical protein
LVIVFNTLVEAPRHLCTTRTAHHTAWNLPHILQKLYANDVFTKQEFKEQLIWNTIGAECRTPYVVGGTYALAAILCWYVAMIEVTDVSVIVPKVFL